jgi:hypothetical protein
MSAWEHPPQPFPKAGVFAKNLTYPQLVKRMDKISWAAYSYVVASVEMDGTGEQFEQYGSAPNFQGGRLTLCTCKHQMRSSLDRREWKGKWIAGFTSRCRPFERHWLFYLTRVTEAHESQADLWGSLLTNVRKAKSAQDRMALAFDASNWPVRE